MNIYYLKIETNLNTNYHKSIIPTAEPILTTMSLPSRSIPAEIRNAALDAHPVDYRLSTLVVWSFRKILSLVDQFILLDSRESIREISTKFEEFHLK